MKKVITAFFVMLFLLTAASAEYRVETADDEYVSDEIFFAPMSTWDKVDAQVINLKKGRIIFYANKPNNPEKIEVSVMPVNTSDKTVMFKSGDVSVASVSADGTVIAGNKVGDTVIEITCGKARSRMKVSVVRGVEGAAMSQGALTLYADRPVTAQLEALIYPTDATIKDVKWRSGDESIAYVDEDGLVYPSGVGTTDVYAVTEDGGFEAKCAVTVTTWEKRKEDIPVGYTDYDITLEELVNKQLTAEPTIFTTNAFPAMREEVESFANPSNLTAGYYKYQFLDLSEENGVDADTLDSYLNGKGVLEGMGRVFKRAAENNKLSEVYLVIHACLESGNGASRLANGIEYNGVTVYNMFGIGAVDADPVGGGAKYAYEQGWTTPEKAVEGGAEWISDNYINNMRYHQNTLYKMRWNPENPAVHQYATDVEWASKQAKDMSSMFEAFPSASYHFDIPVYKGMAEPKIQ